jgi:peptidoglycan-associated lipoprotein
MKQILTMSIAVLAAAFLMTGCAKKVKEGANAGTQVPDTTDRSGNTSSAQTDAATELARNANAGAAGSGQIIYFDFDKVEIRPESAALISTQARNMAAHPNQKLRLEGNTDQRGTREYNIGLGERRAQAVRRALMLQGVSQNQLTTVSFGEERPAMEGDNETAWAKNRRVEMVLVP